MDETLSDEKRFEAAVIAQKMNAKRTSIMSELNKRLDQDDMAITEKTYVRG